MRPAILSMRAKAFSATSALPFVVVVTLAASVLLFLRGWIRSDMASKIAWESAGAMRLLVLSAAYWLLFISVAWTSRKALLLKLAAVALIVVAAFAGVVPVLALLLLVVAAASIGSRIWGLTTPHSIAADAGQLALCAATGLAVLAIILPVAGLFPINNSLTYFVALALPITLYGRSTLRGIASFLRRDLDAHTVVDLALLGSAGNFILVFIVAALLPEIGYDALALHLDVAARVHDFGRWHYDVSRNVYATIPLGGDFLYAAAYMFGGEPAARLANAAMLVLTLIIVYAAVRHAAARRFALVATLIAASSPLALLEASSLFIENPWALFVVGGVMCTMRFADQPDLVSLRAAGLLLAAAMATKAITVAVLPALLGLVLHSIWRQRGPVTNRQIVAVIAMSAALALPPYAIAFLKTGNPVFPFFNAVFESPLYPLVNFNNPRFPGELDPRSIYRFTFYSDTYIEGRPGSFGFGLILLFLPVAATTIFAGGRRERWLLAILVTFFTVVVGSTAYLRYIYPVAFLFAILVGFTLQRLQQSAWAVRSTLLAMSGAAVLLNLPFLPAAAEAFRSANLKAIGSGTARHDFISTWAPGREIVQFLNAYASDTAPVAFFGRPFVAELQRTSYTDSWYMRDFRITVENAKDLDKFRQLVQRLDIGFFTLDSSTNPAIRVWARALGEPVYRAGDATLYKVDTRTRFPRELVKGSHLGPGFPGWVIHGHVDFDQAEGAALVSTNDLLYQPVPVEPGQRYRLAVEAKCAAKAAQYRLQVIWHGAKDAVGTMIFVVPCRANWTETDEIVTAPNDARLAVVYATGHESEPVYMRSSSFGAR